MMAMCRMWACKKQTKKPAAYRRSKEINGFKDKPGSINEGNLRDDPKLPTVPIADLRSFLEVEQTCWANVKHSLAKFVAHQARAVLDNEIDVTKEPKRRQSDNNYP